MREANCVTELAELLVLKRLDILKEPIRGSLQSIYLLYKSFCEETTFSFGGFLKNLQYLNQITNGGAFEMEGGIELLERYHQLWINEVDDSKNNIANIQTRAFDDYQLRIVNIDKLVIKLLLDKMKEKAKEGLEPKSNSSKLVNTPLLEPENNSFKLFNTPLLESNNNSSNLVNTPLTRMMKVLSSRNPENPTYESLCKMLASPTAHQKLAREKASLVTPKTPFLEICDHNTHSLELAAVSYFESRSRNDHSYYKPKGDNNSYAIHINRKLYNKLSNDLKQCLQHKIHFVPIVKSSDFRKEQLKNVHCSKLSGDYIKSLKELNISNTYGSVSTDVALGDCSYLDTCYKLSLCRYIHYYKLLPIVELSKQIFETNTQNSTEIERISDFTWNETSDYGTRDVLPAQWLNCDVTQLDFDILGKFAAIIADPSWNIHMNLPYSSSNDNELCDLPIAKLQDNGVIFLWVTGRAIEQGKSCLKAWGYTYCNEIVWIKTNQLNKTICTGRTGHWLNHSKEHLLVGIKGKPTWLNRGCDLDLIVSSTRETSRKPDELYGIVERLVGRKSRKLEIFGRAHNIRQGWFTIGNQLDGVRIYEQEVAFKYAAQSGLY